MSFKNTVGYLLHNLSETLDGASDRILKREFDIGLAQFRVLLVLEENDGASQKKIADELSQTEASISRQIKILSKKGLIEIEGNYDNKRERLIYQTHQGHDTAKRSVKALNEYHQPIFDSLSQEEQARLHGLLIVLNERVNRQ